MLGLARRVLRLTVEHSFAIGFFLGLLVFAIDKFALGRSLTIAKQALSVAALACLLLPFFADPRLYEGGWRRFAKSRAFIVSLGLLLLFLSWIS